MTLQPSSHRRHAFTLIELMVVIGVIVALAGLSYPAIGAVQQRAKLSATRNLVAMIATAVTASDLRVVQCADGSLRRAWTLGWPDGAEHGEIDGNPEHSSAGDPLLARAPSGYRGLVDGLRLELNTSQVDERRRPIDAWGQPLRIAWAETAFAGADLGVWSIGLDGLDAGTAAAAGDDLRSWEGP